jgi:3-oxo-5alpha-steroid 4-dehydrogenase
VAKDFFDPAEMVPLTGSVEGVRVPFSQSADGAVRPWDEEVDVVVVGFGAAGASAAIEASARGASVLVADRFMGGGATVLSGGIVYLGGGTELQEKAGYEDTPEEMFRYLSLETKDAVSEEVLRAFCNGSVENFEWLRAIGVPMPPSGTVAKVSYPAEDCTLYFSGNEMSPPYNDAACPAPRGHRTLGKGFTGKALFEHLRKAAKSRGTDIRPYTQAKHLIVDADGAVVGVELRESVGFPRSSRLYALLFLLATHVGLFSRKAAVFFQRQLLRLEAAFGVNRYVRVRGGVVLSAGGFIFNPEMVRQHAPDFTKVSLRLGTAGDTGQGIRLGQSAGGKVAKMERCTAWRFINPPAALLHGALIGPDGTRICNEELYGATIGEHMSEGHGGRGFLVLDATAMKASRKQTFRYPMHYFQRMCGVSNAFFNYKKAATLEELGRRCGMPDGALPRTIREYNKGVENGADACGKGEKYLHPVEKPPFYAVKLDFDNARYPTPSMTLGGLVVDGATARVVREDGTAIDGLYAAGRNAVGVSSHSYVSGLSIADCIFSGRNAGRHAAARAGLADRPACSYSTTSRTVAR